MTVLWRKNTHSFEVDIKVGEAWVQHAVHELESEARKDADTMSRDFSVNAVRILSHDLTHECSVLDEVEAQKTLQLPAKMTPTGGSKPCPRCTTLSQVASDGYGEWIFCGKCRSAFPV